MNPQDLPQPPEWGLLLGRVGEGLVWTALFMFLAVFGLSIVSGKKPELERWIKPGIWAGFGALFATISILGSLFFLDQFQFDYIWKHLQTDYEWIYRLSGIWSGQQGSILLWAVMSAFFCAMMMRRSGKYLRWHAGISSLALGAMAGILAFESPFNLIDPADGIMFMPPEGAGMSPTLLNYWMVIHPPTIFAGFGALTGLFALSCSAMLHKDLEGWIPIIRPWAIISTTVLGLGLAMGGLWAYETLGWGGFWAWDPVENASFVPWCLTAALIHGVYIQKAKRGWQMSNLILAGLPFITFVYGTFMTRSGFLDDTSVHSFAEMDGTALKLLIGFLFGTIALYLGLLIWTAVRKREKQPSVGGAEGFLNRKTFFTAGVWTLSGLSFGAAFGMSVPLIMSLSGQKPKAVEEIQYNQTLYFLYVPLMIAMAIAPYLTWNHKSGKELIAKIMTPASAALFISASLLLWAKFGPGGLPADPEATTLLIFGNTVPRLGWTVFTCFFAVFAVVANAWRLFELLPRSKRGIGGELTHIGVAMTILGLIFSRGLEQTAEAVVGQAIPGEVFGRELAYLGSDGSLMERGNTIGIKVKGQGEEFSVHPSLYYQIRQDGQLMDVRWPAIQRRPLHDFYFATGALDSSLTDDIRLQEGEVGGYSRHSLRITYHGFATEGPMGQPGSRFVADIDMQIGDEPPRKIHPAIELGERGIREVPAQINDELTLVMSSINASDGSAQFRFDANSPFLAVVVFYKPLTWLVWLGIGLMTLGGAVASRYRKTPKEKQPAEDSGD